MGYDNQPSKDRAWLTAAGFLRSVSIHLQICWHQTLGDKFFWASLIAGWGLPALFVSITLPLTGTSYRFGSTCHINHPNALADFWGPLLAFAAISTILQFITFGYCIKVYIRSLMEDAGNNSTSNVSSGGLPSYSSRAGSVKTITARQAYRRIKKVIAIQWRGTAIVMVIIVNVVFLAIIFVQMDNTITGAMHHLDQAKPWLLCLIMTKGDKEQCLDKVQEVGLVTNERVVMAVLIILSLNGLWSFIFLGRTSILIGWADLIRRPFRKRKTDFASVDARRFSGDPNKYEMLMSPPTRPTSMPKEPETTVTSPPLDEKGMAQIPPSPSSRYEEDYFGQKLPSGKDGLPYSSPKLSFSTPRPPSASRMSSFDHSSLRAFSPPRNNIGTPRNASQNGRLTPAIEWDPQSTHARPMR